MRSRKKQAGGETTQRSVAADPGTPTALPGNGIGPGSCVRVLRDEREVREAQERARDQEAWIRARRSALGARGELASSDARPVAPALRAASTDRVRVDPA